MGLAKVAPEGSVHNNMERKQMSKLKFAEDGVADQLTARTASVNFGGEDGRTLTGNSLKRSASSQFGGNSSSSKALKSISRAATQRMVRGVEFEKP